MGAAEARRTCVVKPGDPDAKIKFLVKEVPHGVGGFVPDANGNRVANELGGRNCVTGEMWKNKFPSRPAVDDAISNDIAWQHYTGRGVRKLHESGSTLAEDMEAPVSKMPDSIEAHCQASLKSAKDPDRGLYTAFASDKSWNEASDKTGSDPLIQRVQKMEEVPQVQFIDKVVDIPVISERQMSMMNRVQKTVEVPRVQFIDRVVDDPRSCRGRPPPLKREIARTIQEIRAEILQENRQTKSRMQRLSGRPTVQRRGGRRKDRIKTLMSSGSTT